MTGGRGSWRDAKLTRDAVTGSTAKNEVGDSRRSSWSMSRLTGRGLGRIFSRLDRKIHKSPAHNPAIRARGCGFFQENLQGNQAFVSRATQGQSRIVREPASVRRFMVSTSQLN